MKNLIIKTKDVSITIDVTGLHQNGYDEVEEEIEVFEREIKSILLYALEHAEKILYLDLENSEGTDFPDAEPGLILELY
ncbi:hypothetical protein RG959_23445 [Domibacillus sp. 8LH]|uniref:hypothetical protein n=1 Tax=Domibacillus sp. 8LH TaxID=3073900 RepID=UPI00316C4CC8